jgi:hypothetical protein
MLIWGVKKGGNRRVENSHVGLLGNMRDIRMMIWCMSAYGQPSLNTLILKSLANLQHWTLMRKVSVTLISSVNLRWRSASAMSYRRGFFNSRAMGSNNTCPHLDSGPNFLDAFRAIGDVSRDQSVFLPGEGSFLLFVDLVVELAELHRRAPKVKDIDQS